MSMAIQAGRAVALSALILSLSGLNSANAAETSRLATYESKTGEVYYALSSAPTKPLPVADAHQVVVLIDTSATQSGQYRTQSQEVLAALLSSLGENDRVELVAVDTRPVPLTTGFVAPNSAEMKAAVAKL